MNARLAFALALVIQASVWSQGTVNFANGAAGVNAPVLISPAKTPVQGPDWRADLWVADTNGDWTRISQPVPFLSEPAGYFLGGSVLVTNANPGEQVTLRVRVFNTRTGAESSSSPLTVTLGADKLPPANLVGLASWSISERPQLKISLSGSQASVSWSRDLGNFALESSNDLSRSDWSVVATAPATNGAQIELRVPIEATEKYYRLRSN